MSDETGRFVATGYRLVLPPGWVRVPVDRELALVDEDLDRAIREAVPAATPRDEVASAVVRIKGRLMQAAAEAQAAGGLDLYLPIGGMHGLAIPASFLVCEVPVSDVQRPDAALTELAAEPGATLVDIDGARAVRTDVVLPVDTLMTEVDVPTRRVNYLIPVPGASRWLTATFSTVADGDPSGDFAEVLVVLFDSILTTFRFT